VKIKKDSPDSTKEFYECGDYLLPKGFAVERKKGRDFLGSLQSKRLYEQLINLCQYEKPILAIISDNIWKDFYYSHSRYIHSVYIGTLSTITAKFPNIRILFFEDDDQFVSYLISLEKKLLDDTKGERPKPKMRKVESIEESKENVLCAIQGIGIPTSKKLLEKFGSVNAVANATEEDLKTIEKLSDKNIKRIQETLN
jgi:ERCC4-type nuclease